jgi:RNA polymerase sigma-70 factor (ECF subfamily)
MTDAERFEAFVRRYQDMVFATAVRLLGNHAEAEDVVQTVFLRAFERFDEIGESETAAAWLKTVARHACLNHLTRYRGRWRLFSELTPGAADEGDAYESTLIADVSFMNETERAAMHAVLERVLAELPDHQRVPLVLFHFEEMTYQAIAESLGGSLGKIKTDIHRGRLALRARLKALGYAG